MHHSSPEDGYYAVWIESLILSNGLAKPQVLSSNNTDFRGLRIVPDEQVFAFPGQNLPVSVTLTELRYHLKENVFPGCQPIADNVDSCFGNQQQMKSHLTYSNGGCQVSFITNSVQSSCRYPATKHP